MTERDEVTADEIALLWQQVIGGETPAVDRRFVEAGGDSLAAVELSVLLEEVYGAEIDLLDLATSTPAMVARWVGRSTAGPGRDVDRSGRSGEDGP